MSIPLIDTTKEGKVLEDPFFRHGASNARLDTNANFKMVELIIPALKDTPIDTLYKSVPNGQSEFAIGGWTFLSLDEVKRRFVMHHSKFYSVAVFYRGMGHVNMIGYIPSTQNFFMRPDGGSNDYDREAYYEEYTSNAYKPAKFFRFDKKINNTSDLEFNVQYTLSELMNIINPPIV